MEVQKRQYKHYVNLIVGGNRLAGRSIDPTEPRTVLDVYIPYEMEWKVSVFCDDSEVFHYVLYLT